MLKMIGRSRLLAYLIFTLALGPALIANAIAGPVDMVSINAMDRAAFVVKFGGIFEKSPWVAEEAWERRPFASLDEMHAAMVTVAKTAPAARQLALLQAHPDLAGKEAQAGTMPPRPSPSRQAPDLTPCRRQSLPNCQTSIPRTRQNSDFPSSLRCGCTPRKASSSNSSGGCKTIRKPNSPTICRMDTQ